MAYLTQEEYRKLVGIAEATKAKKAALPWKGGKGRLTPIEVATLQKVHGLIPFERLVFSTEGVIYVEGSKGRFKDVAHVAETLKPLIDGNPYVNDSKQLRVCKLRDAPLELVYRGKSFWISRT